MVDTSPRKHWSTIGLTEISGSDVARHQKLESLKLAWRKLVDSLPPIADASPDLVSAVNDAAWPIEFSVVVLDTASDDHGTNARSDAKSAIRKISSLAPEANVSPLVELITQDAS